MQVVMKLLGVSLLALGSEQALRQGSNLELNHQAWVIWSVVDTLLPLTLGATGYAMWRESSEPTRAIRPGVDRQVEVTVRWSPVVTLKFQIPRVRELLSCLMQTCLYVILRP